MWCCLGDHFTNVTNAGLPDLFHIHSYAEIWPAWIDHFCEFSIFSVEIWKLSLCIFLINGNYTWKVNCMSSYFSYSQVYESSIQSWNLLGQTSSFQNGSYWRSMWISVCWCHTCIMQNIFLGKQFAYRNISTRMYVPWLGFAWMCTCT